MDRCHRVYRSRLEWVSGLNWVKTIQILLNVGLRVRDGKSSSDENDQYYWILTTFFCFSLHRLTPRQASWYHFGEIDRIIFSSFVPLFQIETFSQQGGRGVVTRQSENGFALVCQTGFAVCSEWKSKSAKNKRSASSTKLTNKHRDNQWQFVSWIILTWWNFWYCMLVLALQCSNLLMEYQLLNATRSKSVNKWIWASLTCLVLGGAGDVIPENLISQPIQLIRDQSTNSTDQRFIGAIILQYHQQYRSTAITDIADIGHQSFYKKIILNFT